MYCFFNFFKISVFSDVGVDMGIFGLIGARLGVFLGELVHLLLQLPHLASDYQLDMHAESAQD
jgi:hypothetical protein